MLQFIHGPQRMTSITNGGRPVALSSSLYALELCISLSMVAEQAVKSTQT